MRLTRCRFLLVGAVRPGDTVMEVGANIGVCRFLHSWVQWSNLTRSWENRRARVSSFLITDCVAVRIKWFAASENLWCALCSENLQKLYLNLVESTCFRKQSELRSKVPTKHVCHRLNMHCSFFGNLRKSEQISRNLQSPWISRNLCKSPEIWTNLQKS